MCAKERIKQLMEEYGWSEYRLAKEANLSQSTIANVFRRNNAPTLPTLEAICHAFGITLAEFFSENSDIGSLTAEQRDFLHKWSMLPAEKRRLIYELVQSM